MKLSDLTCPACGNGRMALIQEEVSTTYTAISFTYTKGVWRKRSDLAPRRTNTEVRRREILTCWACPFWAGESISLHDLSGEDPQEALQSLYEKFSHQRSEA